MAGLLADKKILILGVANARSIAWATAEAAAREGASLCLAFQGKRLKETVQELAATIPGTLTFPCEVSDDVSVQALMAELKTRWGRLDGMVHSIAFAPAADLEKPLVECSREGYRTALDISAYSLPALVNHARPLFEAAGGGSVVTYTYIGSERAIPGYNLMGPAKAALESGVRYLASELGTANIRVNAVSAGPLNTLAARGVSGFVKILGIVQSRAPLRRNIEAAEVGDAAVFLLSHWARGITGEILHVDAGFHCMGI